MPGHTPYRPWSPLSDPEWAALAPFLARESRAGRPCDQRARLDAILQAVTSRLRWSDLARQDRAWQTVHRAFIRHAHAGLWTRLLKAVAAKDAPPILRSVESWICAAHRRATRILNLPAIFLARRLGKLSALPGPPQICPDEDLSNWLRMVGRRLCNRSLPLTPTLLRGLRGLHKVAQGWRWYPRALEPW